jgi:hypothetical protein
MMKHQSKKKFLLLIVALTFLSVYAKKDNMIGVYSLYSNSSTVNSSE